MAVKVQFKYKFLPMGTIVRIGSRLEPEINSFYLDLGNSSDVGVFDHHHRISKTKDSPKSTTSLLVKSIQKVEANFDSKKTEGAGENEHVTVTIVCHENPDFDCFAAVYILQQYIKEIAGEASASFENNQHVFKLLGLYVDAVDSGRLILDETLLETPYAIATVIEDVIKEKMQSNQASNEQNMNSAKDQDIHLQSLSRGLELIDCVVQGYERKREGYRDKKEVMPAHYLALHSKEMINQDCFQEEKQYLRNDHDKYLNDIKNISTPDRRIKLPFINGDEVEIREVDALFFTAAPSCRLHKHWARSDQFNAPSKNGFVFTFIPLEDKNHKGEARVHLLPNGEPIKTNRVVISVKEDSGVSLYGLGEALEAAELEAEEEFIIKQGMNIDEWRSRQDVRWYNEKWCVNIDPWYDGRNHNYTIVDAPGTHYSLLGIDEIMAITKHFSTPKINDNHIRHLIPFTFSSQNNNAYKVLCELFSSPDSDFEPFSAKHYDRYFLPYIEDYLFKSNHEQCAYFQINENKLDSLTHKLNESKDVLFKFNDQSIFSNGNTPPLGMKLMGAFIVLFKYGIGYLVLELKMLEQNHVEEISPDPFVSGLQTGSSAVSIDMISEMNKAFEKKEAIKIIIEHTIQNRIRIARVYHSEDKNKAIEGAFDVYVRNDADNKKTFRSKGLHQIRFASSFDSFTYCMAEIMPNSLYILRRKEITYLLSNLAENTFLNTASIGSDSEKYFYNPTSTSICYQSKNGTCLVLSSNYQNEKAKKRLRSQFLSNDFYTLLLALHQRHVLLHMASILARSSWEGEKILEKVSNLREEFMEFTIRSWFSQITNDEAGMENYCRWQEIFDNEIIFTEISTQIEAYDTFNHAKMSKAIEILTAVFFPLVAFGTIYAYLVDINKALPGKVLGYQIVYQWLWLGIFFVFQYIWLRWLYSWNPTNYVKSGFKQGFVNLKERFKLGADRQSDSSIDEAESYRG